MGSAAVVGGDRGSAPATDAGIAARLRREIISRRARIGVIGQGYVGLPLSVAFGDAGFDVLGFDVDPGVVAAINAGRSHIPDVSAASIEQLVADGFFRATQEMAELGQVDAIVICVPTPLSKTRDPNISYVIAAADQVTRALRPGQLVILESTTYPGTTRDVVLPRLLQSGLRAGEDFFLAFSPERVDPGNAQYGIKNTPKVVGGLDAALDGSGRAALPTGDRDDRPGLLARGGGDGQAAREHLPLGQHRAGQRDGVDVRPARASNVWEVIDAAATKPFGFMPFYPGPGSAGTASRSTRTICRGR